MAVNNENIEANASSWMPDVLGNGFHMYYVSQGIDYSGNVRCTIIRKKARQNTERGVLYIHGFSVLLNKAIIFMPLISVNMVALLHKDKKCFR